MITIITTVSIPNHCSFITTVIIMTVIATTNDYY